MPPSPRRRVLIIGAGSSGLAAIQQSLQAGLEPVCFEARAGVGGAWRYDANPGDAELSWTDDGWCAISSPGEATYAGRPPPSPMYSSLRTNVPTSLMNFRGRPFPPTVGLFARHEQVQDYLEDFAESLLPHIRFNTRILSLRHSLHADPSPSSGSRRWFASYRSTLGDDAPEETDQFDAVFVANGHYSRPYIPFTEGLRSFTGEISHARWYRNAERYMDKTVLVIGNSASGYDITRELAASIHERRKADPSAPLPRIYQAARSPPALGIPWDAPDAPEYSKEVRVFPPIRRVEGGQIEFENDEVVEDVDAIIFATGYYFSFPFCAPTSEPFASHPLTYSPTKDAKRGAPSGAEGGIRIHGLDDRLLFYRADPTLAFLALPYLTIPFPLAQLQARLAALHFASSPLLPSALSFPPDPFDADPSAPESRAPVTWAEPRGRQYDVMDRMMRESGDVARAEKRGEKEGEREGEGEGEGEKGGLTGERALYGLTSLAERDLRVGAKALRKAVLGY
ncbi:monooxygenase [Rhodotorula kratochvilovae]